MNFKKVFKILFSLLMFIVAMTRGVRLRKPPNRGRPARIGTRGETNAQRKEREIIRIYTGAKNSQGKGGAKLIEAHGALRATAANNSYKVVPEDTVIIFLSQFGQCMSLMGQRTLSNEYFTSEAGLMRFFRGEAGMAGIHHGEILSRTKFTGQKYPDVYLEFKDAKYAAFGWVWSLPTKYKRPEGFSENWPIANQIINSNIHGKSMRLSEVIDRLGKGVYIVASCLVAQNQVEQISKIPYNLPLPWKARPARRSRTAAAFAENIFKKQPLRPGSFVRRTRYAPVTGRVHKGPPRIKVAEVLAQLGRRPNRVNLRSKLPSMRANVNQGRLMRIQKILQDPTNFVAKLSQENRNAWNRLGAVNKGEFVNRHMNKTAPKPVYYFRGTNPITNQQAWFNKNGTRINQPSNFSANKLMSPSKWNNSVWNAFEYAQPPINMLGNVNTNFKWHVLVKNHI